MITCNEQQLSGTFYPLVPGKKRSTIKNGVERYNDTPAYPKLSNPFTDIYNAGKDAINQATTDIQSDIQKELKDKAKQVLADYAENNPNKVRATVATGVVIGLGACAGLLALGYWLRSK